MNITFIYVTHDQEEALTMSDTVVVMNGGVIQQVGTPEEIYNEPRNAFVADFIGDSNIIDGVMHRDFLVSFAGAQFPCVDRGFKPEQSVQVVVRPEDIEVVSPVEGQLTGVVEEVIFKGGPLRDARGLRRPPVADPLHPGLHPPASGSDAHRPQRDPIMARSEV